MKFRYLLLAGCCAAPLSSMADTDEVIVTASRLAETADESLASVTVIDRATIERGQASSLPDALRQVTGLSISDNGGAGQQTSLFLRGSNANHTLLLVDGVKLGSATSGALPWQYLPVEQIDRIEVVRGPRSSLYGSEAIGGVVQVFTRRAQQGFQPHFSLSLGDRSRHRVSLGGAGSHNDAWYGVNIAQESDGGIDVCDGDLTGGCFIDEPDRDGYRNLSVGLNGGHRFGESAELSLNWLSSSGRSEYDGGAFAGNQLDYRIETLGLDARVAPTAVWSMRIAASRGWDDGDYLKDGVFVDHFDTRRDSVQLLNDFDLVGNQVLTLGADYQQEHIDSQTAYAVSERDNRGLFMQYLGRLAAQDLQLSLRQDDNQQFGKQVTGNLAWGADLNASLRAFASYGTAFRAPSFNDLYFPFGIGNPSLQPEESTSLELGLDGAFILGQWQLNLFMTEVDNLIVYDAVRGTMKNLNQAHIQGIETGFQTNLVGWELAAGLSLLEPKNRSSGPNRGNLLPRRSKQRLNLSLDRDLGVFALGADLLVEGSRYDDVANTIKLAGYAKLDLRAEYRLDKDWRLQGRVENLFDADYQLADHYNQPGRGIFVTLRYHPDR